MTDDALLHRQNTLTNHKVANNSGDLKSMAWEEFKLRALIC